jgi:histidinol-phosphate aminotransferase
MDKMRLHGLDFNLTVPSVAAADAALADSQHLDKVIRGNDTQRSAFNSEMKSLGYEVIPSQANFAMVNVRTEVSPVIEEFLKRKILVGRPFPPMTKFLRVSIGTDEEMRRFYSAFRQILR